MGFLSINIMIATSKSRAHLNNNPKIAFHRHRRQLSTTNSTQLWVALTTHKDSNTP